MKPAHQIPHAVLLLVSALVMRPTFARAQCADWRAGPLDNGTAPNGVNGTILALTSWDADGAGPSPPMLVAGGDFTSIEGVPTYGIAARDPSTGQWQGLGYAFAGGGVVSLAVYNGDLIAAGSTSNGVIVSEIVSRWVPAAQAWQSLAFADGGINALAVYNGDLIAGGGFTSIGGVSARLVARWNGSTWAAMSGGLASPGQPNTSVRTLAVCRGELVAGGSMWSHQLGGPAPIARWNGSSWSYPWGGPFSTAWGAWADFIGNSVDEVGALYINDLLVASGSRIARWDGSAWSNFTEVTGTVGAFTDIGGSLIMGGSFSSAGGVAVSNIASWNGSSWSALGSGIGNPGGVSALTAYSDSLSLDIIAGGTFTTAGDKSANHLARWNGNTWTNFGGGTVSAVNAFATLGTNIIAAGDLYQSANAGYLANNIVKYDGAELSTLGLGLNSGVYALKAYSPTSGNHELVVGGRFTTAGRYSANHVARWIENPSIGSPPPDWEAMGAGFNNWVLAVERVNSTYVAGGLFTQSGATTANRVALWNESTHTWSQLQGGTNGTVRALKYYVYTRPPPFPVTELELVAGGDFSTAGGTTTNRIAMCHSSLFTPDNFGAWEPMGSGLSGGIVYAIERHAGSTYAAGSFVTSGATTLNRIGRWTGSAWVPVGTGVGFNQSVYALKSSGTFLYASGAFTSVDGIPVNKIARWNGTVWEAVPTGANNSIVALGTYNGELQVGGYFDTVNNGALAAACWGRYLETGAPWIADQTSAQSIECGQNASFSVQPADGYSGLTFVWRKDTVPLTNGPTGHGSTISGADTADLDITQVDNADVGNYDCVVSNSCGSDTSAAASLTVTNCPPPGDMNGDGVVNYFDVDPFALALTDPIAYQQQYAGGDTLDGDMNHDLVLNALDIAPFILCVVNGQCP